MHLKILRQFWNRVHICALMILLCFLVSPVWDLLGLIVLLELSSSRPNLLELSSSDQTCLFETSACPYVTGASAPARYIAFPVAKVFEILNSNTIMFLLKRKKNLQ